MTDDLGARFEAAARRAPDGAPDIGPVMARGKRTKVVRYAGATVGAIAAAFLAIFTVANLDMGNDVNPAPPAHHDDGDFVPAESGEPTYVLTDFRIEYPWAPVDGLPMDAERREQ